MVLSRCATSHDEYDGMMTVGINFLSQIRRQRMHFAHAGGWDVLIVKFLEIHQA